MNENEIMNNEVNTEEIEAQNTELENGNDNYVAPAPEKVGYSTGEKAGAIGLLCLAAVGAATIVKKTYDVGKEKALPWLKKKFSKKKVEEKPAEAPATEEKPEEATKQ